jgi:hypothetical protein
MDDIKIVSIDSLTGYTEGDLVAFRKFDEP